MAAWLILAGLCSFLLLPVIGGWAQTARDLPDGPATAVVNVKDFGAIGDGATLDGAAIEKAVDFLNTLPDDARPSLVFPPGCYLITGSSNLADTGMTQGIKPITHDNVTVLAWGAELRVPDTYPWERTQVGGGDRDHFARGFVVDGRNFTLYGGFLNGNLHNRSVARGPTVAGYGGGEMGLRINAPGARVFGTVSRDWGTDSCYVSAQSEFFDCTFAGGRRLGVAVVLREGQVGADNPIRFVNCRFLNNSRYADDICNNPGTGIDIENEGGEAAVHLINCLFSGNRTYAIYISAGARDTLIQGCVLHGSINLQPSNLGGHRIINNYFGPGSFLFAIYGNATDAPSAVIGNTFEDTAAVIFRQSQDYPNNWTIARNVFLNPEVTGVGGVRGEGHVIRDNTFTHPETP